MYLAGAIFVCDQCARVKAILPLIENLAIIYLQAFLIETTGEEGAIGICWVMSRDVAKYPIMNRTASPPLPLLQQRTLHSKMSIVQRLRTPIYTKESAETKHIKPQSRKKVDPASRASHSHTENLWFWKLSSTPGKTWLVLGQRSGQDAVEAPKGGRLSFWP